MIIDFPFQYRLFFADVDMYNHALIEKINNKVTGKNPRQSIYIVQLSNLKNCLSF